MAPHLSAPSLSDPADIDLTVLTTAEKLLVALDFDGVIAPLQDDPSTSAPVPKSAAAVEALAGLPNTVTGYISGRNVSVLKKLSTAPGRVVFVGSHGVETDFSGLETVEAEAEAVVETAAAEGPAVDGVAGEGPAFDEVAGEGAPVDGVAGEGPAVDGVAGEGAPVDGEDPFWYSAAPTEAEQQRMQALDEAFERIVAATPAQGHGRLRFESKPLGRTFHTRGCSPNRVDFYHDELHKVAAQVPGLRMIMGHDMVEFGVRMDTKGNGLDAMIDRVEATAAVYIGDDTTDEDAFEHLHVRMQAGLAGLTVKVGPGDTAAEVRVDSTAAVAELLTRLAAERAAHLEAG